MMHRDNIKPRVLLLGLFSRQYPAVGETHALSVLAGELIHAGVDPALIDILDMSLEAREVYEKISSYSSKGDYHLVGVSTGYGTFSKLAHVRQILLETYPNALRVYGGATATYCWKDILSDIDPQGVVVVGEGENSIVELFFKKKHKEKWSSIDNICFFNGGDIVRTERRLTIAPLSKSPHREHILPYLGNAPQIFLEYSRGCSWAACSFCLRGLLDIKGTKKEYRRFTHSRVLQDLKKLAALGIREFTFADEDFIGRGESDWTDVQELSMAIISEFGERAFSFDVSALPGSLSFSGMSEETLEARSKALRSLKASGLRKVFLGIESGSVDQLKRFRKSHDPKTAAEVAHLLIKSGFEVDVGWILFDPFVSLKEIHESLSFLRDHELEHGVSFIFNSLRLQTESRLLTEVQRYEEENGIKLVKKDFDRDTLSFEYTYFHPGVSEFEDVILKAVSKTRCIHYVLKSLTRHGSAGMNAQAYDAMLSAVWKMREEYVNMGIQVAEEQMSSSRDSLIVSDHIARMRLILLGLAKSLEEIPDIPDHPLIFDLQQELRVFFAETSHRIA
ncbi:radical SAM protein [Donghicola sp. XS_ASV15]|uniref:B12-binding domain-containing radical SAM protein n=1 Tax=Donghicola sp. XS_ASV15 TaxID=3241295 RepID=UPI0035146E5F